MLLVVSGPSGAGKGAIARRLLGRQPRLWPSVSATTRERRDGEVDGIDYRFVSSDEFERLRAEGSFLESFEVFGNSYGTPRGPVEEHLAAGDDVLLEVDVQGALAVREAFPQAVLVFVRPPSRAVQRERLERRGVDDAETIERRLAQAKAEEALAGRFDAVVVNDDLERATGEMAAILEGHRTAP